jgi:hypothetical protein
LEYSVLRNHYLEDHDATELGAVDLDAIAAGPSRTDRRRAATTSSRLTLPADGFVWFDPEFAVGENRPVEPEQSGAIETMTPYQHPPAIAR